MEPRSATTARPGPGPSAGQPFRWGILGTAEIAERFVRAVRSIDGAEATAIASRDASRAERWGERFGVPRRFGAYGDLLASGTVDAVYVALPNSLHCEWTLRAIDAGLPTLCEKPLATTAADARRVAERAAAAGVPVMEAFMYRFHPHFERLVAHVRSGAIGEVRTIDAVFTFRLDDRSSIVASAELGGGALLDVGCYAADAVLALGGGSPARVSAVATGDAVDDVVAGVVALDNGVLGRLEASIDSAERHWLAVSGTTGTVVSRAPWVHGLEPSELIEQRHGQPDRVIAIEPADATASMLAHFMDVVRAGGELRIPLADSVRTMALLDALRASARPAGT